MKFEKIFINIITTIIFLLVIGFVGSLFGLGIYSIWQIIGG